MQELIFRQATEQDAARCWALVVQAKRYMASLGRRQWDESYPLVADIERDIAVGSAYVLEQSGRAVAYGAVSFDGEPEYARIEGAWLSGQRYVVLHRLCVADEVRGRGVAQQYFVSIR